MKKSVQMIVGVAITGIALFGCGGGGGSSSGGGGPVDTVGTIGSVGTVYSGRIIGAYHVTNWSMNVSSSNGITGHTNNDQVSGIFDPTTVNTTTGAFTLHQPGGGGGDLTFTGTVGANGTVSGTWTNSKFVTGNYGAFGNFSGSKKVIPANRFTFKANGTVYDSYRNLTWLKNADCFGVLSWQAAQSAATGLATGQCGVTDGKPAGSWRLPTLAELIDFTDDGLFSSTLLSVGFGNVSTGYYWTADQYAYDSTQYRAIGLADGDVNQYNSASAYYVWPVRTGQ